MMYLPMVDSMYSGLEPEYLNIAMAQFICFECSVNPYRLLSVLKGLVNAKVKNGD